MWIAMGYLNDYTIKSMNEWMNEWMYEWMNDILSKNWLTISIHYSQPMICKSVTRMSFIQSILFYSILYSFIVSYLIHFGLDGWLNDWINQQIIEWMNEWTNERKILSLWSDSQNNKDLYHNQWTVILHQ